MHVFQSFIQKRLYVKSSRLILLDYYGTSTQDLTPKAGFVSVEYLAVNDESTVLKYLMSLELPSLSHQQNNVVLTLQKLFMIKFRKRDYLAGHLCSYQACRRDLRKYLKDDPDYEPFYAVDDEKRAFVDEQQSPFAIIRLNSLLEYEKNLIKWIEESVKVSEEGDCYGDWEEDGSLFI